jgi:WD repeat-containing protein 19
MTLADWSECPSCHFPASTAQFMNIVNVERKCPMCNEEVDLGNIRRLTDPLATLKHKG